MGKVRRSELIGEEAGRRWGYILLGSSWGSVQRVKVRIGKICEIE
jgi:hypothetical protein